MDLPTLASVRDSLVRQEDSIVFSIIERARHPRNSRAYVARDGVGSSLLQSFVRESEVVHSKGGRYQNPEEVPFFPDDLPAAFTTHSSYPQVLHPTAARVNVNNKIWSVYLDGLLPLFTVEGDDGNYASAAALDLACLQALSRRIHYGMFVAEVKFRDAPQDYSLAIRAQDEEGLTKLLTFPIVEEAVKARVKKKGMVFGQNVTLNSKETSQEDESRYKVDPEVFSRLYGEWIMPLTKLVQLEYLLHRLD